MPYPLIILGAGASHGYSAKGDGLYLNDTTGRLMRPPVTNQLIEERYLFAEIANDYREVYDILGEINLRMSSSEDRLSFEQCLTHIMDRGVGDSHRLIQLVALHFYLRDFFGHLCKNRHFLDQNAYSILINRLIDLSKSRACVVSFNYDTLFERSIELSPINQSFRSMGDYIDGDIKIFKPHGSHDWVNLIRKNTYGLAAATKVALYNYLKGKPELLNKIVYEKPQPYHETEIDEAHRRDNAFMPAIAIPLNNKQNYVFPDAHFEALTVALKEIDRILIIGWRAADDFILDLIKNSIPVEKLTTIPIHIVAEGKKVAPREEAEIILSRILEKWGIINVGHAFEGDFAKYIGTDKLGEFLDGD